MKSDFIIGEYGACMPYTHSYYGPWLAKDDNEEWYVSNERNMILNMTQGRVRLAAGENDDNQT